MRVLTGEISSEPLKHCIRYPLSLIELLIRELHSFQITLEKNFSLLLGKSYF